MRNMLVVIKETYLRHVKSWSFFFMVISPFLFIGLSGGIGYLQGSSLAQNNKVAVVSSVPAVTESLKSTNGINFDYKDEASAQEAIKDEKIMVAPRSFSLRITCLSNSVLTGSRPLKGSSRMIRSGSCIKVIIS